MRSTDHRVVPAVLGMVCLLLAGCSGGGGTGTLGQGDVQIEVNGVECTVTPPMVVIDSKDYNGGKPKKVKFKVRGKKFLQKVEVKPAQGQTDPGLFNLPTWVFTSNDKDAEPLHQPQWSGEEFRYTYKVWASGVQCDPEICIRNGSGGCFSVTIPPTGPS